MTAKDLKNALLQEAVQGKLVPQIASEGNARDLLEEIRKERLSHGLDFANAKSGKKSKKETALAGSNLCDIPEDEIPFDIPESWCWCRLSEVCSDIADIDHRMPPVCENGIPYISPLNFGEGNSINFDNAKKISKEDFNQLSKKCKPERGDIIFPRYGTIGVLRIVETDIDFLVSYSCATIKTQLQAVYAKYIYYVLMSPLIQKNEIQRYINKTTQPNIGLQSIKQFLFPLPPLAEQKRIVAAIEKFMPLIEEYGKKETALNELNAQIGTLTKKAILQEAVQGKLVPQIPSEGNAKDLLEQIKAQKSALIKEGKIKKEKPLPEITEDEIPFDIPENWCWCRLGEIVPFGQCSNAEPSEIEPDAWVLDLEDIEKDSGKILSYKTMKESDSKSTKHIFKKDYVLYSKLRPYLNKCVIATQDGYCTSEILPLNFGKLIYNKYAQLYLRSPFFVDYTNSLSFGVKMPRLGTEDGKKALFPLPPLSEQKRIVAAIEQLLPLCEKLGR